MELLKDIYKDYAEMPYISPKYEDELGKKPIPKRNMVRTEEGLLPGDIILLWRIQFGTFTSKGVFHKYFYTTYGIDAEKHLQDLIEQGYVEVDTAFDSLRHIPAGQVKEYLKAKGIKGLSKMKRADLDQAIAENYSEEELSTCFDIRGYSLTDLGHETLSAHKEIVDKHPQKKF